jgi:hypothetical protein
VFFGRRRYVFVLSHMRSYSSLLCHILGSHPEISGYAEMHQSYDRGVDLLRLRARVSRSLDDGLEGRFVLDKILHNEYRVALDVVNRPNVFSIFVVREPSSTIASILKMGRTIDVAWYSDCEAVTSYYEQRIAVLGAIGAGMDVPGLAIRAESIIDRTGAVLEAIETFLGLSQPLTESYRIFKHTGEVGWGDSSEAIRTGRVVRGLPATAMAEIAPECLARATRAYAKSLDLLGRRSAIV